MIPGRSRRLGAGSLAHLPRLGGPALDTESVRRAETADAVWGFAGCAYAQDRRVVGYVLLSPAAAAPSVLPFGADAAVVTELRVAPSESIRRMSRDLIRSATARLARVARPVAALEGAPCVRCPAVSAGVLAECGFAPSGRLGIVRLELAATSGWQLGLEDLRHRLDALLRPAPPVEPARRSGESPGHRHAAV